MRNVSLNLILKWKVNADEVSNTHIVETGWHVDDEMGSADQYFISRLVFLLGTVANLDYQLCPTDNG